MAKKTRSRILRRSSRLKLRANGEYQPRVRAGREIFYSLVQVLNDTCAIKCKSGGQMPIHR
jgi:hypothetical protein